MRPKPLPRRRIRPGLVLRRQPRLRWALVGVAAAITGLSVTKAVDRAERAEAAWGTKRTVVMLTEDLAAGAEVDGSNSDRVDYPVALVPEERGGRRPDDERLGVPVRAGELLLDAHLAPEGSTELAARLPGARAVAIPLEVSTTPAIAVGDTVDVLVALAPEAAGNGPPGFAIAERAPVVDVTEAAVTVAVPATAAPRIAVALGQGTVTLALVAPSGARP